MMVAIDELVILRKLGTPWRELEDIYGTSQYKMKKYLNRYVEEEFFADCGDLL